MQRLVEGDLDALGEFMLARIRVLRVRFDKRVPMLGGEGGFERERRILEEGCGDLEGVVGGLRRRGAVDFGKGEGGGGGRRRSV